MVQALTVTSAALQYAPWSFSKIETGESCPAQFKHKHLLRTSPGPSTPDTVVGTAAHGVLERRVGGASAADAKKAALEETPLTSDEGEMLRVLDDRIEDFLHRFDAFCRREGVVRVLVEEEWGFTTLLSRAGFFDKGVFFRGKMDLGAITRNQELVMIDHKSGVAKDLSRDSKKQQQLQSYAVLALANVPGIVGVRGGIHYLQGSSEKSIQWMDYVDVTRVREVYAPWLFGRINHVAESLRDPFPARPKLRWPCEWCAYQARCPSYQEAFGGQEG